VHSRCIPPRAPDHHACTASGVLRRSWPCRVDITKRRQCVASASCASAGRYQSAPAVPKPTAVTEQPSSTGGGRWAPRWYAV
jgi:hypothetical protein